MKNINEKITSLSAEERRAIKLHIASDIINADGGIATMVSEAYIADIK